MCDKWTYLRKSFPLSIKVFFLLLKKWKNENRNNLSLNCYFFCRKKKIVFCRMKQFFFCRKKNYFLPKEKYFLPREKFFFCREKQEKKKEKNYFFFRFSFLRLEYLSFLFCLHFSFYRRRISLFFGGKFHLLLLISKKKILFFLRERNEFK